MKMGIQTYGVPKSRSTEAAAPRSQHFVTAADQDLGTSYVEVLIFIQPTVTGSLHYSGLPMGPISLQQPESPHASENFHNLK